MGNLNTYMLDEFAKAAGEFSCAAEIFGAKYGDMCQDLEAYYEAIELRRVNEITRRILIENAAGFYEDVLKLQETRSRFLLLYDLIAGSRDPLYESIRRLHGERMEQVRLNHENTRKILTRTIGRVCKKL
jgi:hypothetical protein